jgi:GT2 family glycosyltransferase
MPEPLISAVVPAFDAEATIGDAVDSILAQRGPFRIEVVVVDDGSTDATAARAAVRDGVRVVRQPNRGPSAARNLGIRESGGDLIAFLDADDQWPPGRLAAQLPILDADPDIGLVCGDCTLVEDGRTVLGSFFEDAGLDEVFFGHPTRVRDPWVKLFRLNYIATGSVLARRRCLEAAGGFAEDLHRVEDLDLWFRVARHCGIGYTRTLCQRKHRRPGALSDSAEAMTLAYLEVLARQRRAHGTELRQRGIRLAPRIASELSLLGDRAERAGQAGVARRWYLRALAAHPSVRPLYYWLRSLLPPHRGTAP